MTTPYAFEEAIEALADLAADRVNGAAVIRVSLTAFDALRREGCDGGGAMSRRFRDRAHAGVELAERARGVSEASTASCSGCRGEVSPSPRPSPDALDLPLDAFVVRKVGVPGHEELAMGAIAPGGVVVWNDDVLAHGACVR